MSKLTKPCYEELERRFQSYCKHDGGRVYKAGENSADLCAVCGWDMGKCQHRNASRADKFCRECGECLKCEGGAA